MGTSLELRVLADDRESARLAEDRVLGEIDHLALIFSAYDSASEFSRWQAVPRGPKCHRQGIYRRSRLRCRVAPGRGLHGLLLNVGGDLRVRGEAPRTLGIAAPWTDSESTEPIAFLEVKERAVSTSGSSQRGFRINGQWYSHILDPRSGLPADRIATGLAWSILIDASAIVLTFISLTGLVLLSYLKLGRIPGLAVAIIGTIIVLALFLLGVP